MDENYPNINFHPLTYYTITIKPPNNFQYIGIKDIQHRLARYTDFMRKQLQNINSISFVLWTELSMPFNSHTKFGETFPRLHQHGFFMIHHLQQFLLHDYIKLTNIGHVYITEVSDLKGWYDYCTKQQQVIDFPKFYNSIDFVKSLKSHINGSQGAPHPPPKVPPAKGQYTPPIDGRSTSPIVRSGNDSNDSDD